MKGFAYWRKFIFWVLLATLIAIAYLALEIDKTAAGLSLNIVGAIVIAIFGIPQPDFSIQIGLGLDLPDEEDELKKIQGKRKFWHTACSYIGIAYMVLGFAIQLWQHLSS